MEENKRIPPAIHERFEREASKVCEWAEVDYHETFVTREELVVCLQERWRGGIRMGLSDEDALSQALESFKNPTAVAKSLRKPWWVLLLTTKRYERERLIIVFLAYVSYLSLFLSDTHWKYFFLNPGATPLQMFFSSGPAAARDGLRIMMTGFLAVIGVIVAQAQSHFEKRWVNQFLSLRHLLLLFTGYALFSLVFQPCYLFWITLPHLVKEYPSYFGAIVYYCVTNFTAILLGWSGAVCLLFEVFECDWKGIKGLITFAGFIIAAVLLRTGN